MSCSVAINNKGGATVDSFKPGSDEIRKVHTTDRLLSFNLPKKWKPVANLNDQATLQYGNLFGEQYMIVLSEPKEDFDEGVDLEVYCQACMENMKMGSSKCEESNWETSEIGGFQMKTVEVKAVVDGLHINYFNGYYETDTHFHQVMQWTLPSKWDQSLPVYKAVLDSIVAAPQKAKVE